MNKLHSFFYRFSYFRHIKWAIQRVYRGWDDRVLWNVDAYLAQMIPLWLIELKKKESCPILFSEDKPELPSYSDNDWASNKQEWDNIVDKIILGFRAAEKLIDGDSPAWDKFFEEYSKRYGSYDFNDQKQQETLLKELGTYEAQIEEEKQLLSQFNDGIELFRKYFFNFWS
jgi:hypothetical protein